MPPWRRVGLGRSRASQPRASRGSHTGTDVGWAALHRERVNGGLFLSLRPDAAAEEGKRSVVVVVVVVVDVDVVVVVVALLS